MLEDMGGFKYGEIEFDKNGDPVNPPALEQTLQALAQSNLTDVFIFSHGWNNDQTMARELYKRFFDQIAAVLTEQGLDHRKSTTGVVGVIWPSRRWSDEEPQTGGGAVALATPLTDSELVLELKDAFPEHHTELEAMADLLAQRPDDESELQRFQNLMATLVTTPDAENEIEDNGEDAGLFNDPPNKVFKRFSTVALYRDEGGAAGIGDVFHGLWNGAREALRQATYFEMKRRAGIVGRKGLGPWINRLGKQPPPPRVHLLGHSFGARLVSFALTAIPDNASPVKSLTLIQGAFSHFAFAPTLPQDGSRSGALAGMTSRVDGPITVTHTRADISLGKLYPLASLFGRQDAAGADDLLFRWGAMGHDGAQESNEVQRTMIDVGEPYELESGKITNLDSNSVINHGGLPSGAHSDIVHPEVAWAVLSAARMAV